MSYSVCKRVLALLSLVVLSADIGVLAQSHLRNDSPRRLPTTTPDSRQAESLYVDRYLKRCGYLEENGREILPEARKQAISQLQEKAGLAVTGTVDRNTLNKMVLPGCGAVTSTTPSPPPPPRLFDRVLTADGHERSDDDSIGYKWSKTRLTWKLANVSPDISQSAQRRAFHDAFKLWSEVSPLTFQEVTSGHQSDITIRFTSSSHGDGFAFDGPGGEVGHAFFPENGNIHLDDDELWTDTGHGMHLTTMAAHLIGHALGLAHSQEPSAIMSTDRIARGRTVGINLHHNDVSAIQRLYGQKNGQAASTTTTRSYPTRPTAGTTSPRPTPSPSTVRTTTRQSWPIRTQPTTAETATRRTTAGRFSTTARPTSTTRQPHHHRHSTTSSTSSKLKSLDIHDPDDRRPVYPVVKPADKYSTTTRRTVPTRSTPTWRSPPTTSPRYARYTAPTTTTAAPTTTRYVWTRPTRGTTESTTSTRRTPPTRYRETTTTPSPPVWTTTRAAYTRYPPRTTTTTTTEYTTRRTPPTRPVYTRGTPSTTTEYVRRTYPTTPRPAYTRGTPSTAGPRPVNTRSTPPSTTKTTSYVRRTYPTTTSRPVYTRGTPSTTTEYVRKTQPTTTIRPVYTRSTPSTRQTWPPRTQPTTTVSTTTRPHRTTRPVISRTTPTRFPTTTTTTTGPTTTTNTGAPTKPAECSARFDAVMQGQDGKVYAFYSQWIWRLNDRGVELGPVPIGRFFEDAPTDISSAVYSKLTNYVYLFKGKKIWKYQNFRLIDEIEVTNSAYPTNPRAALINLSGTIFLMKDGFYWSFDEVTQDIGARYSMWPKFADVPTDVEAAVSLQDTYMYFFKGTSYYKFDETSGHVLPGYPKSTAGAWFGPQCNNGRVEPK